MGVIDFIQQAFNSLLGIGIVSSLMVLIFKGHATDWNVLAKVYGRAWTTPHMIKSMQTVVLYSKGRPAKNYSGVITIGLFDDGVGFRPHSLLMPFHKPIFVPYSDLKSYKQDWYLNTESKELEFLKIPDMRLVMPASQLDWIASTSKGNVEVSSDYPSHSNWPWMTRGIAIFLAVLGLCTIIAALSHFIY